MKPEQGVLSDADAEKGKYQRGEKKAEEDDEEARKLKMGKGKIPDKKDDGENVKLKPIPEKQVNFIELYKNFNYDIIFFMKCTKKYSQKILLLIIKDG